ncbi:putative hydro-lyase [Futiania mangrovi]|uniref:Putative hydro-lyase NJQ99_14965 n=1 Tax=Futiania mangrovi TaxID=2959716 RepID=A0A9J6PG60_9PROT|nr:putative hydro-lyase [Futiania mangrovii]MCP1337721.1 putative hydro-lyase [Futiania mangrovii]
MDYETARSLGLNDIRSAIRSGAYTRHTAGLADGYLQCNLVILPKEQAADFRDFCLRNPRPCPLIAMSEPGVPHFSAFGTQIDLRTDVPRYRVYRDGEATAEPTDISDLWREDLVAFALGCSFTFERALIAAGVPLRHIERDVTVPMFATSVACERSGPFRGNMVVSMRPIAPHHLDLVDAISGRYPHAHGAPVHQGNPAQIGITDIMHPQWGEAVEVLEGEVPVFWACGVTPQNVLTQARLPFCITHAPGHMLITTRDETSPANVEDFLELQNRET